MQEQMVPASRLISWGMWGTVGMLIGAAWTTVAFGHWEFGLLFGFTACALSAIAAAFQVRCFILHAVRIVVAAIGENDGGERTVRSMRR